MATGPADRLEERLAQAEAVCARAGARLTEIRREVLALILASGEPVGAYALLDRLKLARANAAPVTVYRALEFLLAHGLIHKVERLNAFIGCIEHGGHDHAVQFLICSQCGGVSEIEDAGIAAAVASASAAAGFRPGRVTVEVEGRCSNCS